MELSAHGILRELGQYSSHHLVWNTSTQSFLENVLQYAIHSIGFHRSVTTKIGAELVERATAAENRSHEIVAFVNAPLRASPTGVPRDAHEHNKICDDGGKSSTLAEVDEDEDAPTRPRFRMNILCQN